MNQVLKFLLKWEKEEIRKMLISKTVGWNLVFLVAELCELDICSLYQNLTDEFGIDKTYDVFVYILNNDPSFYDSQHIQASVIFKELPFPRYLVALVYSIIIKCPNIKRERLINPVWNNILSKKHLFWPDLIVDIMVPLYSNEDITEKAIQLITSNDIHERNIGDNIIYGYLPNIDLKTLNERISILISQEQDNEKLVFYKKIRKQYFSSGKLINRCISNILRRFVGNH